MTSPTEEMPKRGARMFIRFANDVTEQELVQHSQADYQQQARNVNHRGSTWSAAEISANIYFEIVCFGAFSLSIASIIHTAQKRLLRGSTFDRLAWAAVDTGISDALYKDVSELDQKYPGQSHTGSVPAQAAKLAVIGYKQNFTDYNAQADMLVLSQRGRPLERCCVLFSQRLSDSIDPLLCREFPAFQRQWIQFARQIVDWTGEIVQEEFQGTV